MSSLVVSKNKNFAPSLDAELGDYLRRVHGFPILESQQEQELARSYHEEGNLEAAHALVTSHLRLVAKLAMGYRGYGLPIMDLIAEGNVGLMQAVKKFDPEKGFRLATYAMWWIKASIQEYVLRSWSLVRLGTTSAQKRLFFNLRRVKDQLLRVDGNMNMELSHENVLDAAADLGVRPDEIVQMDSRLTMRDSSLNITVSDEADSAELQDFLVDESANLEEDFMAREQAQIQSNMLLEAMDSLNARERLIITRRRLQEDADTLEVLSQELGISRERVRQIEARAMEKLKKLMVV